MDSSLVCGTARERYLRYKLDSNSHPANQLLGTVPLPVVTVLVPVVIDINHLLPCVCEQ